MTNIAPKQKDLTYPIIDTGMKKFYGPRGEIPRPEPGEPYYGQDAQYEGIQPAYKDNGDGTVSDMNTGLIWSSTPFIDQKGAAVYIAFGKGTGKTSARPEDEYDVHGAGAMRSDPMEGDPSCYLEGGGPQKDTIRIYNYARCVRTIGAPKAPLHGPAH